MFDFSVGKKPVPNIASSRTSTGGSTGEPAATSVIECEAVERELEQRGVADDVAEPRAREAGGALELEAAELARLLRLAGPAARRSGGSRPRRPLCRRPAPSRAAGWGRGRVRRRGRPRRPRAPPRCCGALPSPASAHRAARVSACPSASAAAEVVDTWHERAPALVGCEQGIERLAGALARERGPVGVGVVARSLRVDQAGASIASRSGTRPGPRAASGAGWRTSSASRFGTPAGCRRPVS